MSIHAGSVHSETVRAGRVGVVETRGIEPVPDTERHGRPAGLFWMWLGANLGVLGITLGAALVTFSGLNIAQAAVVSVVGAAGSFLPVGLVSIAGARGGAPGLTLSRAVFGVRGNWGPTVISWLGFVGWETIMCITATYALLAVLDRLGIPATTATSVACVLATVTVSAGVGLFGHATVMWMQKWLSWVFGALTVVVVGFLAATVDWSAAFRLPAGPFTSVVSGIGFVAAGTGIGWLAAGADYARYLPRQIGSGRIVGATVLGATAPLAILLPMGALMAAGDPGLAAADDPVAAIGAALPDWMLLPYLLTAAAGLVAAADVSLYSSGLNLLTGGIRVRRATAVVVDSVLITIGAVYITVVSRDFHGPFTTFLTLLAVPLAAWAAVFLVDLAARRDYDAQALVDTRAGGRYWYRRGVHLPAAGAWLAAITVGLLCTRAQAGDEVWFAGPLAHTWIGHHGLGWLVAAGTAAVLYAALRALIRVPEVASEAVPEPVPAHD